MHIANVTFFPLLVPNPNLLIQDISSQIWEVRNSECLAFLLIKTCWDCSVPIKYPVFSNEQYPLIKWYSSWNNNVQTVLRWKNGQCYCCFGSPNASNYVYDDGGIEKSDTIADPSLWQHDLSCKSLKFAQWLWKSKAISVWCQDWFVTSH